LPFSTISGLILYPQKYKIISIPKQKGAKAGSFLKNLWFFQKNNAISLDFSQKNLVLG
jgi:hypothetical protein